MPDSSASIRSLRITRDYAGGTDQRDGPTEIPASVTPARVWATR
ncbi:hypothetical protein [Glutamicibacter arilaitensis]|nr:hypothetical protein [Glutamicibacter arilaitensis]